MRIAVFCGASRSAPRIHLDSAAAVGEEIARRGHTVIFGGGRTGLMGALADAALAAGGTVRGVILREWIEQDVHHPGLHELTEAPDMRARKAGLDERADAFLALPGGLGTLEELAEILSFRKLGLHHRLLVFLNTVGFYDPLLAQLEAAIAAGLEAGRVRDTFRVSADPRQAVALCCSGSDGKPGDD